MLPMLSLMILLALFLHLARLVEHGAADVVADVGELARLVKRLHEEDSGDSRARGQPDI